MTSKSSFSSNHWWRSSIPHGNCSWMRRPSHRCKWASLNSWFTVFGWVMVNSNQKRVIDSLSLLFCFTLNSSYGWNGMHFSEGGQTYPQKIMPMEGRSFYGLFLGVCAKLQRLTIKLWHVCPSVYMEQLNSKWTEIHEIWYLNISQKFVKKIKVSLKNDMNNRHFAWRPMYIYNFIALNSSQNEKCCGHEL